MKLTKILLTILCLLLVVVTARAIPPASYNVYATTGAFFGGGSLSNSAIIGAFTKNGGAPVLTFLNASALHASATVQFYSCTNFTDAKEATTNVRTNYVGSTNGFSVNTVVVVRHLATDTYERLVMAPPNTTNIVFASDPATPLAVGDLIYQQTAGGTIQVATNNVANNFTINLLGDGIYSGTPGRPLLIDCITAVGTNGQIKAVSAKFVP